MPLQGLEHLKKDRFWDNPAPQFSAQSVKPSLPSPEMGIGLVAREDLPLPPCI
jgi:hypothetical protein